MAFLGGLFGGNQAGSQAAQASVPFLQQGANEAQAALARGYGTAKGEYGTNYYDPYTQTGTNANTMYSNALGLIGPGGNTTATNAFQTSPGYQFQLGQGTQALDRSAAGSGLFGSGNAAMALNQYGQGLANQDYGNWLSRLQGLGAQGLTAAAGQTGRQGSLAGLDVGLGQGQTGVWNNLTNNVTQGYTQGQQADAAINASGMVNLFSALLGGANLGLKASGIGGFAPRNG